MKNACALNPARAKIFLLYQRARGCINFQSLIFLRKIYSFIIPAYIFINVFFLRLLFISFFPIASGIQQFGFGITTYCCLFLLFKSLFFPFLFILGVGKVYFFFFFLEHILLRLITLQHFVIYKC